MILGKSGWVLLHQTRFVQEQHLKTQWHSLVMVTSLKCSMLMIASPVFSLWGCKRVENLILAENTILTLSCFLFMAIVKNYLFKEKLRVSSQEEKRSFLAQKLQFSTCLFLKNQMANAQDDCSIIVIKNNPKWFKNRSMKYIALIIHHTCCNLACAFSRHQ